MRPARLLAFAFAVLVSLTDVSAHADPLPGFVESWPGTSTQGWQPGIGQTATNPGTGGARGAEDGYLHLIRPPDFVHHFGVRARDDADYSGNWIAAGIVELRVSLNDVDTDQDFEIHVAIGNASHLWQYDPGFAPPEQAWQEFVVDLRDSSRFTRIIGTAGFAETLHQVGIVLIRHDRAPFEQHPDPIAGELGIDEIQLLSERLTPVATSTWGRIKRLYR